ncbi:hypothetical protein A2U01_0038255, partial [Trifolium medium]|nr:hypothetical protein [Trifolium medium]
QIGVRGGLITTTVSFLLCTSPTAINVQSALKFTWHREWNHIIASSGSDPLM